jgi:uncharacterized protein YjbI with pentapeptide repeats
MAMPEGMPDPHLRIQAEVLLREEPQPGGFVNWMDAHKEAIGTFLLIIGGLFTFYRYVREEENKAELQRETLLVQFYGELDDKGKRNTAAYALATLSGEAALPVLIPKLKETAQFEKDPSFLNALNQSLILIGDPALREVLRVNREIYGQGLDVGNFDENKAIIVAMQPTIVHFLRHRNVNASDNFAGMALLGGDLRDADLTGLNFSGSYFEGVDMCAANLSGAKLLKTEFSGVELGGAKLNRTLLTGTYFDAGLQGTSFESADGTDIRFPDDIEYAAFPSAILTGVDFSRKNLRNVRFTNAQLARANFISSDLESADFSGADLDLTLFGAPSNPMFPPHFADALGVADGVGAFVRNADFNEARHVSNETRQYLCKWGARNVPGGCGDVAADRRLFITKREDLFGGSGGCF